MLWPLGYAIVGAFALALVGGWMLRASAGQWVRYVDAHPSGGPAPADLTAVDVALLWFNRRDARYHRMVTAAMLAYLRVAGLIRVDGGALHVSRAVPPDADPLVRACHEVLREFDGARTNRDRDTAILDEVAAAAPVRAAREAAERRFERDGHRVKRSGLLLGTVALAAVALAGYALAVAAWSSGGPWLLVAATAVAAGAGLLHGRCVDQASRAVNDFVLALRSRRAELEEPTLEALVSGGPALAVLADALFPAWLLSRLDSPLWTLLVAHRQPRPAELSPTYYDKAGGS